MRLHQETDSLDKVLMQSLQAIAAFCGVFQLAKAWSTRCLNPTCQYSNAGTPEYDWVQRVPIYSPEVTSLEEAIQAAFEQSRPDDYTCKDTEDCVQCMLGEGCTEHCRGSQAENGPQLVHHGQRIVFQLERFQVFPFVIELYCMHAATFLPCATASGEPVLDC